MIVPTKGKSDARVAQPTSIGSSIRRRASAKVQNTSAAHTTMSTRIRTLTAVLSASLSIPKTPKMVMRCAVEPYRRRRPSEEHPPESVAEGEEDQDRERHDDRDEGDHPQHARTPVVHSADALRVPGAETRSATR